MSLLILEQPRVCIAWRLIGILVEISGCVSSTYVSRHLLLFSSSGCYNYRIIVILVGSFVFNRITDKLLKISDTIYCCKSGSAADTEAVAEIVRYKANLHKYELMHEFTEFTIRQELDGGDGALRVKTVAALFQDMCYEYRHQLLAGMYYKYVV